MVILYRQQISANELQVLAEAWAELCSGLTDDEFSAAVRVHCRESKFFPCPAEILQIHEDSYCPRPALAALTETTSSQEEAHRSAVSASMCLLAIDAPEAKEFFRLTDWAEKDTFARRLLGEKYPEPGERDEKPEGKCPRKLGDVLGRFIQ